MNPPASSRRLAPFFYLFAGMAVFGSATPVSKLVVEDFPPLVGGLGRALIAAAVLAPLGLARRHELGSLDRRQWAWLLSIALIGVLGFSLFMLYGMRLVSGVAGSIVMSTAPAVTAAGAILFLGERFGWRKAIGAALAVAGVLTLHLSRGGQAAGSSALWLGSALVLAAVCCEAWYSLAGKHVMAVLSPLQLAFWAALASVPLFAPGALWQWSDVAWGALDWRAWAALAWWGAGTMALGSWLWYRGMQQVPGSVAAPFMGVMPVSALVLSYVLLGERFEWIHVLGFGIVLAGILLVARARHEES